MGALVLLGVPTYVGDTPPTFWEYVLDVLQVYAAVGVWALLAAVMPMLVMHLDSVGAARRIAASRARRHAPIGPQRLVVLNEAAFSFVSDIESNSPLKGSR